MTDKGTLIIKRDQFEDWEQCEECAEDVYLRGTGAAPCLVTGHVLLTGGLWDMTAPVCDPCARKLDASLMEAYARWQNESTAMGRVIRDGDTFADLWRRSLAVLDQPVTIETLDRACQVLADGQANALQPPDGALVGTLTPTTKETST